MGYKKPKCDCGCILKARRSEHWLVERSITKNGEISDYIYRKDFDDSDYEIKLICVKCGNSYEADYDDRDRIIRR